MTPEEKFQEDLKNLEVRLQAATQGFKPLDGCVTSESVASCVHHGHYRQWVRRFDAIERTTRTDCPQCLQGEIARLKQREAERKARVQVGLIADLKYHSGVPKRFEKASFENYEQTEANAKAKRFCQAYANKWQERKAKGGGLILCGKPGTGKNHLACAIINHVIEQYQDEALLTTALRIARKVKSSWNKNAEESEEQVMRTYIVPNLLVIDEIGVQFGSEAEKIILFEIINERYEAMKPTILISNLSQQELGAYVGERIVDRMREGGGAMIAFDWESYRK